MRIEATAAISAMPARPRPAASRHQAQASGAEATAGAHARQGLTLPPLSPARSLVVMPRVGSAADRLTARHLYSATRRTGHFPAGVMLSLAV